MAREIYAAPLVIAVASAIAAPIAYTWGESLLALYFLFWLPASLSLAFIAWRRLFLALVAASEAVGILVLVSPLNPAFKLSTIAMMIFLAYMAASKRR